VLGTLQWGPETMFLLSCPSKKEKKNPQRLQLESTIVFALGQLRHSKIDRPFYSSYPPCFKKI
jgi:hypothetical protein